MAFRFIRLLVAALAATAAAVVAFAAARRWRKQPSFHGTWDPT